MDLVLKVISEINLEVEKAYPMVVKINDFIVVAVVFILEKID